MQKQAGRLTGLGTTIFTEMTALAERTGAINLGQGFPDSDGPGEAIEAAVTALRSGANQYAPLPGVPALREAVLAHQRAHYGLEP
jgi:N-succinyldiaminopimelate aminotransferase